MNNWLEDKCYLCTTPLEKQVMITNSKGTVCGRDLEGNNFECVLACEKCKKNLQSLVN